MKNILLPIDFHGNLEAALKKALVFLQKIEGHFNVFLLKTYIVPVSLSSSVIDIHDELRDRVGKELEKELEEAQQLFPDGKVSFDTMLQMGRPANVITRLVRERNIDCVILGPIDNNARREEILNLLSRIHCPIVILP